VALVPCYASAPSVVDVDRPRKTVLGTDYTAEELFGASAPAEGIGDDYGSEDTGNAREAE